MRSSSDSHPTAPFVGPAATRLVAGGAVALLGLRQFVGGGLTTGFAVALALVPVWFPALRRQSGGLALVVLGLGSAVSGVWLTQHAAVDHVTNQSTMSSTTLLLLSSIAGAGVVVWARGVLGTGWTGTWFGVGMLLSELMGSGRVSDNPWKYAYAVPLAIILLSLAERSTRRRLEIGILLLLAVVSASQASRSYAAEFSLAAVLVLWQVRPTGRRRASVAATVALIAAAGVAVYNLGVTLLLDGYLGDEAQQRSVEQVDATGSLLLGGRPEISATLALMRHQPLGFGSGVVPSPQDILVAKGGMAAVNYDPDNGYVENYMFGGQFKLHSVTGDLWAYFGVLGLVLALVIMVVIIRGLVVRIAEKRASALVTYLGCLSLWNLVFSPLYTSAPTLVLCVGLLLVPKKDGEGDAPDASGAQAAAPHPPRSSLRPRPETQPVGGR